MRPVPGQPSREPSPLAQTIRRLVTRAQRFVVLRRHRQEIVADAVPTERATIRAADTGGREDQVLEARRRDRRGHRVRDGLASAHALWSTGTLVTVRE